MRNKQEGNQIKKRLLGLVLGLTMIASIIGYGAAKGVDSKFDSAAAADEAEATEEEVPSKGGETIKIIYG